MKPGSSYEIRLDACLTIALRYLLFVCFGCTLRLAAHSFGIVLSPYGDTTLRYVLTLHGVAVVAVWILRTVARKTGFGTPIAAKMALAMVPVLLLASMDRLALLWHKPIVEQGLFVAHPTRGWTSRPGWTGVDDGVFVRINRQGFRGPDVPSGKGADEYRILFLGDSLTFGPRVKEEAIFVTRLEAMFAKQAKKKRVMAINASVAAYSPWHEYDLLINDGLPLKPDLVIQIFCLNDVLGKFQLEQFGGYSRGYEPAPLTKLEWSGLYRAARVWWAKGVRPADSWLWHVRAAYSASRLLDDPHAEDVRQGWRITLDNMGKIVAASRQASVPIVIVCAPHMAQLTPDRLETSLPQTELAAFAHNHGVAFLDLLPIFRKYVQENNIDPTAMYYDPLHFSPLGHEVAAAAICDFLIQNLLID